MIKGLFEFTLVSAFDRELLACEICYKKKIIAEISQEGAELILEIYAPEDGKWWEVSLNDFQQALEDGKKFLLGSL